MAPGPGPLPLPRTTWRIGSPHEDRNPTATRSQLTRRRLGRNSRRLPGVTGRSLGVPVPIGRKDRGGAHLSHGWMGPAHPVVAQVISEALLIRHLLLVASPYY